VPRTGDDSTFATRRLNVVDCTISLSCHHNVLYQICRLFIVVAIGAACHRSPVLFYRPTGFLCNGFVEK